MGQRLWGPGRSGSCASRGGLAAWLDGLAVGGGDGVGDQGDVAGVEVAEDGAQLDGDGGVAEAGGDPQDGLLGGGAGQLPGLQGAQGGVPADGGERLAGADAGAGGDGAAGGARGPGVPLADVLPRGGAGGRGGPRGSPHRVGPLPPPGGRAG